MTWNPDQVSMIGSAYSRHGEKPFGVRLDDRLLHLYIVGQTGTGKSTLLANLAAQDAKLGMGFCLIDPHGDLALTLHHSLKRKHHYWDASDPGSPYGYNPLTRTSAPYRSLVASGLIDTLKKQWSDAWGVRMEHLLRYAILALLETPRADLEDIMHLYLDKDFRKEVVQQIRDEQVRAFWTKEYPAMKYQGTTDGVASIANKLGALLAHPVVRKALTRPEEPIRFRRLMDQGEILIVNLAKGQLGADISNVLGGMLVASMMNAAFTRHELPEAERNKFFLYIDEFHNFTTAALASMLSETRKYGLGLVLAHQHIVQTEQEVFESVLGNVGSLMVFRVGALDAPTFARQLGDTGERDLQYQPNYQATMQIMVHGQKTRPFSARTWSANIG